MGRIKIRLLTDKKTMRKNRHGYYRWCGKWGKCKVCKATPKTYNTTLYRIYFNETKDKTATGGFSICREHLKELYAVIEELWDNEYKKLRGGGVNGTG